MFLYPKQAKERALAARRARGGEGRQDKLKPKLPTDANEQRSVRTK